MYNQLKISIFTCCLLINNVVAPRYLVIDLDDAWSRSELALIKMQQKFAHIFNDLDRDFKNSFDEKINHFKVDLIDEAEQTKLVINLPYGADQSNSQKPQIDLETKDLDLKGTITGDDYQIKLAIINGKTLKVTCESSLHKENKDTKNNLFTQTSTRLQRMLSLPSQVDHLENTQAVIDQAEHKVILSLPKAVTKSNASWRRIEIK